jgi:hypothetical protein
LNETQKRDLISDQLKDTPSISDRAIAGMLGVNHESVGGVQADLEQRGEIRHVTTFTDTLGHVQPRKKPIRTTFIDETPEGWNGTGNCK